VISEVEQEGRDTHVSHVFKPGSIALTIWGDPIVGQALMRLMRSSGYKARFLSALSLNQALSLEGSDDLLLLTPTPQLSTEHRKTLLEWLRDRTSCAKIPVLELATSSEETPRERTEGESWYRVAWPCRIEELRQRIEAALSSPVPV
jgi:hypothetical protein